MDGARPEVPPPGMVPGLQGRAAPPPEQYAAYTQLLAQCWHQDPAQRPEFSEIVPRLRCGREGVRLPLQSASLSFAPPPRLATNWGLLVDWKAALEGWPAC